MNIYMVTVTSRYNPLEGKRTFKVFANDKKEAWDKVKFDILCTDEYKKVKCEQIK